MEPPLTELRHLKNQSCPKRSSLSPSHLQLNYRKFIKSQVVYLKILIFLVSSFAVLPQTFPIRSMRRCDGVYGLDRRYRVSQTVWIWDFRLKSEVLLDKKWRKVTQLLYNSQIYPNRILILPKLQNEAIISTIKLSFLKIKCH